MGMVCFSFIVVICALARYQPLEILFIEHSKWERASLLHKVFFFKGFLLCSSATRLKSKDHSKEMLHNQFEMQMKVRRFSKTSMLRKETMD